MGKIGELYRKSDWYQVFNFSDDRGSARSFLLISSILQAVINGLTTGVFYSGYLSSFGIDIISISVLSLMPYATSLLSVLTPVILERFKKRRAILLLTKVVYYAVNILGLTLLPLVVHDTQNRITGLIVISFLANAINSLFISGYSAWQIGYVDVQIRFGYQTALLLVSGFISGVLMLALGVVMDGLSGQTQQTTLAAFRSAAFLLAMLDVYFLHKPKEPEYKTSANTRISLGSALRIPLSNKRFMLLMLVVLLYYSSVNMLASVCNTWLLEDIKVSYTYLNFVNMTYAFFILPTSAFWGKLRRKRGTLATLAIGVLLWVIAAILHAFLTPGNYLWLMTVIKLIHNCVTLGISSSSANIIYIALPEEDQTSYLSFYQLLSNAAVLLGMSFGTWGVAAIGDGAVEITGYQFTAVPFLFLVQALVMTLLAFFLFWLSGKLEPEGWKFKETLNKLARADGRRL